MILKICPSQFRVCIDGQLRKALTQAIGLLYQAHLYSVNTSTSRWQFSIEASELLAFGLTRNEIRWLLHNGIVLHAREVTTTTDRERRFVGLRAHQIPIDCCFILSDEGLNRILPENRSKVILVSSAVDNGSPKPLSQGAACFKRIVPIWNIDRRELYVGGILVKRFRTPAANQELVIKAFAEEGWPERIDNPLTPSPTLDGRRKLNDTIKCLNRNQATPMLTFRGDGSGNGVLWELHQSHGAVFI